MKRGQADGDGCSCCSFSPFVPLDSNSTRERSALAWTLFVFEERVDLSVSKCPALDNFREKSCGGSSRKDKKVGDEDEGRTGTRETR